MKKNLIVISLFITTCLPIQAATQVDGKTLEQWTEQVKTGCYRQSFDALRAIIQFGAEAESARPALLKLKEEAKAFQLITGMVEYALIATDPKSKELAPGLIKDVKEAKEGNDMRELVEKMYKLGAIGPVTPDVIPTLADLVLNSESRVIQGNAATALGMMNRGAYRVLPELRRRLNEKSDTETRQNALIAISQMGTQAEDAIPDLVKASQASDPMLQGMSMMALASIGKQPDVVLPQALRILQGDAMVTVKSMAVRPLGSYTPLSKIQLDTLIELLQSGEQMLRADAARTLGYLGSYARPALPALKLSLTTLSPRDKTTRDAVEEAIRQIEFRMKL